MESGADSGGDFGLVIDVRTENIEELRDRRVQGDIED